MVENQCLNCNMIFQSTTKPSKFCSRKCRTKYYYTNNKEKVLRATQSWRNTHKDHLKEYEKAHRKPYDASKIDKIKVSNYNKKCYYSHLEQRRLKSFNYYRENYNILRTKRIEKYYGDLEMNRKNSKEIARSKRVAILSHYGNKCGCCGENRTEFLVLDHIDGGGNQHRKELRGKTGQSFYDWIIKNNYPEGYRILCDNCNASLGRYNYCPHMIEQGLISKNDTTHLIESRRISYKNMGVKS